MDWQVSIKNRLVFTHSTQHATSTAGVANFTTVPGFYVGAEVQNSGPWDCMVSASPSGLSQFLHVFSK